MEKFAYFDSSHEFPEEILHAAGFHALKILGSKEYLTSLADPYIAPFVCANVRSALHYAFEQSSQWKGIVIAHGCDVTNRQYDIWESHLDVPMYYFHSPLRTDMIGQQFLIEEMEEFILYLKEKMDRVISNDLLSDAIKNSNKIKKLCQTLGNMRSLYDITNQEYFIMMKYCVTHGQEDVIPYLTQLYADWSHRKPVPQSKIPIFLTGSDINQIEWFEFLEKLNLRVIRDDLTLGERYYATLIPETNNPIEGLAEYYTNIPRSSTKTPISPKISFIQNVFTHSRIRGVLSQNIKFCEVVAYDMPFLQKIVQSARIPFIHIEREFTPNPDQQIKTRLEAFIEILQENGS